MPSLVVAEAELRVADHLRLTRYDSARRWLGRARASFARLPNRGGLMRCLNRHAQMAEQQGRYATAVDYVLQGLAIDSVGDQRRFHTSLTIQLAHLYVQIGEYQQAEPANGLLLLPRLHALLARTDENLGRGQRRRGARQPIRRRRG